MPNISLAPTATASPRMSGAASAAPAANVALAVNAMPLAVVSLPADSRVVGQCVPDGAKLEEHDVRVLGAAEFQGLQRRRRLDVDAEPVQPRDQHVVECPDRSSVMVRKTGGMSPPYVVAMFLR
jgi:hypothetical protein